jgi:arylsulfatase A-like enzyme
MNGAKPRPVYAAMLENLDSNVGRVLDSLARRGELDRTLVIFTSDNGGEENATDNAPLRGAKGMLYEGGIRVPLFIRWPGGRRGGQHDSTPVVSTDLAATILEASGVTTSTPLDGEGLLHAATQHGEESPRPLFWHYPHYHTPDRPPCGAVRLGDWKLIEFYETGRFELYNLHEDPSETTDLHERMPAKTAELASMLAAWRKQVNASMPEPRRATASPSPR